MARLTCRSPPESGRNDSRRISVIRKPAKTLLFKFQRVRLNHPEDVTQEWTGFNRSNYIHFRSIDIQFHKDRTRGTIEYLRQRNSSRAGADEAMLDYKSR